MMDARTVADYVVAQPTIVRMARPEIGLETGPCDVLYATSQGPHKLAVAQSDLAKPYVVLGAWVYEVLPAGDGLWATLKGEGYGDVQLKFDRAVGEHAERWFTAWDTIDDVSDRMVAEVRQRLSDVPDWHEEDPSSLRTFDYLAWSEWTPLTDRVEPCGVLILDAAGTMRAIPFPGCEHDAQSTWGDLVLTGDTALHDAHQYAGRNVFLSHRQRVRAPSHVEAASRALYDSARDYYRLTGRSAYARKVASVG